MAYDATEAVTNYLRSKRDGTLLRCQITNNPCGTDTWMIGAPCKCARCQEYLATLRNEQLTGVPNG